VLVDMDTWTSTLNPMQQQELYNRIKRQAQEAALRHPMNLVIDTMQQAHCWTKLPQTRYKLHEGTAVLHAASPLLDKTSPKKV